MKKFHIRVLLAVLLITLLTGCGRKHRFDYIDIASSEKTFSLLKEGFEAVPDSLPDGRSRFLLQQGVPVADILVYPGERPDSLAVFPEIPTGFSGELIGTESLLDSLCVKNGHLYTEGGMNARILYLQDERMSLKVLNKIASLVDAGAFLAGVKPSVCLEPENEAVFQRTVDKVWLSGNATSGKTVKSVLKAAGVRPDVRTRVDSLTFRHLHLPDAEIYHICNLGTHYGKAKIKFRVRGREPKVWNPDTGEISPVSYTLRKRSTTVLLNTVPGDDTFIVFASFADKRKLKVK